MKQWPFDQPPNCAVITLRQIIEGGAPILHVTHDSDDHGWQFLTLADAKEEDALIVCFSHVVERDPTLLQLADLPPGWHAWRKSAESEWIRELNPDDEDEDEGEAT
jgi:hypothetical protein